LENPIKVFMLLMLIIYKEIKILGNQRDFTQIIDIFESHIFIDSIY